MKLRLGPAVTIAVVALLAFAPLFSSDFFVEFVLTRTLILGMAAATIVFLTGYAGMTSLAQLTLFGVAGFMVANASVSDAGSKGLALGWGVWTSVVFAMAVTMAVALLMGLIAARTVGIYYLMLTFIFSVIGFTFFGSVTTFSGFGGIGGVDPPGFLEDDTALYYAAVVLSVLSYFGLKWLGDTPFGLTLQGIRDEPVRMAALGFNVPWHRAVAFTAAGFVAGLSGVLNVWWNGQIDPTSIGVGATIDLLIVAVLGGIARLEGAWIGAIIFVVANVYLRDLPLVDQIGLTEDRFNTIVGLLVLLIVVVSPDGIVGLIDRVVNRKEPSAPSAEIVTEEPTVAQ
jgi:branched-chain amino acid transport system permease protein